MAYQYGVGGTSPIIPHAISPAPRAITPTIPIPGAQGGPIQPGSITYTTTTDANGQVVYHPFKAVPASYETPQGLVTGIQWVPAEATRMLPMGATPATADILASFQRPGGPGSAYRDEWQRDEERRRRKEDDRERRRLEREEERIEKEIRRARDRDDRDRRKSSGHNYERDLDRLRDLDLRDREREYRDREYENAKARSRTGSMYGDPTPAGYPTVGYPTSPYGAPGTTSPYPAAGGAYAQGGRPASPYQPGAVLPGGVPGRPVSPIYAPPVQQRPASPYQPVPGALPRAPSPYQAIPPRSASPYQQPPPRSASPYQPPGVLPSRSPYQTTVAPGGVYPPGHVLEGQGIGRSLSRAPSPVPGSVYAAPPAAGYGYGAQQPGYGAGAQQPGYGAGAYGAVTQPQPMTEQQPMPAPEGFSRPPNLAQPYTRFDTFKVAEMDDFFETVPRMPLVLVPHDVYHDDWIRMMTDLALAWASKLPVPDYARDGRPPKRTVLASDLIDLWNASFFLKRGVEVVLYKGRERRSGRNVGTVDVHLPGFEHQSNVSDTSDSDSSSSDDDDDDANDRNDRYRYGAYGGVYGRQLESQLAELQEAKRLRRERKKLEKKRRRQEKKQRRKQKEAERKYALYITCVPPEP